MEWGDINNRIQIHVSRHEHSTPITHRIQEFDVISAQAKDFISLALLRDARARMTAAGALDHEWLKERHQEEDGGGGGGGNREVVNNKANLRRFLARRRWQRCGQAIRSGEIGLKTHASSVTYSTSFFPFTTKRAMKRMSGLLNKRRSTRSSDSNVVSVVSDVASSSPSLVGSSVSLDDEDDCSSSSVPSTPTFAPPPPFADKQQRDGEEEEEFVESDAQFVYGRLHRSSITIQIGDVPTARREN